MADALTAFRYASALDRLRSGSRAERNAIPRSMLGTLAVLEGTAASSRPPKARYHVVLEGRGCAGEFFTSTFRGDHRQADLEDAFELGDFDTLVIEKVRGTFGASEAAKVLRDVVEDLSSEHLPWLVLDGDPERLVVHQEWDFDRLGKRSRKLLSDKLLEVLRLCGFAPRVLGRQSLPHWLEVRVDLGGEESDLWALPGPSGGRRRNLARDLPQLKANHVVLGDFTEADQRKAAELGKRLLSLSKLVQTLHEMRIETIRTQMLQGARRRRTLEP